MTQNRCQRSEVSSQKEARGLTLSSLTFALNLVSVTFFAFFSMLLAPRFPVEAQQPAKVPRIGYLTGARLSAIANRTEAFRQGLRELGYVEGKSIVIEWRSAESKLDRLPALAAQPARTFLIPL